MTLGLVAALLLLVLLRPGALGPLATSLEYDTLDFWFSLRDPRPSQSVAILAVDDTTLRRWDGRPFEARDIARLLALCKENRVRAVALAFPSLPAARGDDLAILGDALRENGPVCLPFDLQNSRGAAPPTAVRRFSVSPANVPLALQENGVRDALGIAAPPDFLLEAAAGAGHLGFSFDRYGRARRLPLYGALGGRYYPALSLATAEASGIFLPLEGTGAPLLNYPDPPS